MKRDTRGVLVGVAAELLDSGGPAAVTLRGVGKRAGVSHNAPYKHFESKEDLLAAIASRELERQSRAMSAIDPRKRPLESLRARMHGYVRWARAYPERFRLTFGAWTHGSEELGDAAMRSHALLISIVEAAQAAHQLPQGNPDRLASLMRAVAHGAIDLALAGHISASGKGSADPEMLVDDLFKLLRNQSAKERK
jgi:AcrR family transcriptional regulator